MDKRLDRIARKTAVAFLPLSAKKSIQRQCEDKLSKMNSLLHQLKLDIDDLKQNCPYEDYGASRHLRECQDEIDALYSVVRRITESNND